MLIYYKETSLLDKQTEFEIVLEKKQQRYFKLRELRNRRLQNAWPKL